MNSAATSTDKEASKSDVDMELDNLKEKEKEIFNVENEDEKTEQIIEKEILNPSEINIEDKHNELTYKGINLIKIRCLLNLNGHFVYIFSRNLPLLQFLYNMVFRRSKYYKNCYLLLLC